MRCAASLVARSGHCFSTALRSPHILAPRLGLSRRTLRGSMAQATQNNAEPITVKFSGSMDTLTAEQAKVTSPSAERNKEAIEVVLKRYIQSGAQSLNVLEVASGTGQHVSHFAAAFPGVTFQPSDCTNELFGSVAAWAHGLSNVHLPPLILDASQSSWPSLAINVDPSTGVSVLPTPSEDTHTSSSPSTSMRMFDCIIVINMTHIAPWEATLGLLAGAARHLRPGGHLFIYGPFKKDGQHTTDSNAAFDASLRQRNAQWGYRDIAQVQEVASGKHGLVAVDVHEMPANNFMLVFAKSATAD